MPAPLLIYCHQCGLPCGRRYLDRPSLIEGSIPGLCEGMGENFQAGGFWHCSVECAASTTQEVKESLERLNAYHGLPTCS